MWGRLIARTAVRRAVWVLVGLAVYAVFGSLGRAEAATCGVPSKQEASTAAGSGVRYPDLAQAAAACRSLGEYHGPHAGGIVRVYEFVSCELAPATQGGLYARTRATGRRLNGNNCGDSLSDSGAGATDSVNGWRFDAGCPAGTTWDPASSSCATPCSNREALPAGGWRNVVASGENDAMCNDSCVFHGTSLCVGITVDGEGLTHCGGWAPTGESCSVGPGSGFPGEGTQGPTDSDGDGTGDGTDPSPNNPGSGGQGNNGKPGQDGDCGGEGQPECGAPGSGSGNGNTSGGGGDCKTPPSSTGDAILAQIAFQTWATRCAVTGNANAGGGDVDGDGEDGQPEWTAGDGPDVPIDDTDYVEDQRRFGLGLNTDVLDRENIFGGGSCPMLSVTVYGRTVSTAEIPEWCELVRWLSIIIPFIGAYSALQILMGRFNG